MAEGYYVEMDGMKCVRRLIELAGGAVAGIGDGRILIEDAKALFAVVVDAKVYTDVEKETMKCIRESYKFAADEDVWCRTEVRKWAATK